MADSDSIIVRIGKDLKLDNALQVGSNESVALPGYIRYNSSTNRFEGFTPETKSYNNSKWAYMTLDVASPTELGGVKIGNNLGITLDGTLNATANAASQKVQRILLVAQPTDAGDYTSINQCVNEFFGYNATLNTFPDGELASLNKTDYPDPSEQNRYVIKVTPGIYSESNTTISLPPYVSLIGENRSDCIIKMDSNIAVECRNGSFIGGLTLDLSNANAGTPSTVNPIGILANSAANTVIIRDCDFVVSQLASNTTCIDYRGGVTGGLIENCRITASNLALPSGYTNETITGVTCNNAAVTINNLEVLLEGYRASKTALKVQNSAVVTGNDCRIVVTELNTTSGEHQNDAVLVENSDLELNYSRIECQGYDLLIGDSTQQCQGINMTSNIVSGTVTLSDLQFVHYEDSTQYDEILVELSTQDFSTVFARDSHIKISGATQSRNNSVFRVVNVYTEDISGTDYSILQVAPGNNLADETVVGGSVTIKELYNVALNSSRVTATNATLRFTPYSGQSTLLDNFQITSSRTLLQGGGPNVGANNFRTDRVQEIVVGSSDGDFTSVKAAIDSITARGDSGAEKPYLVTIRPGKYLETGTIVMPDWVTISGECVGSVEVEFNNSAGSYAQNTALTLSGNCCVENLVLRVNDTLDVSSSESNVAVITSDNLTGIELGNTTAEASANTLSDIRLVNLDVVLGSGIATTGQRHGIHLFKTNADIRDVNISATTADISESPQTIVGYKQTLGNTKVYDLSVNISGSESNATAYGAMLDRSIITANNPQITCACSGASGVINRGWFATNVANTDDSVLTVSGFTNILASGSVRSSGGATNQSLFADYNSTIIARSLLMQGDTFTYNDSENSVPNSFLKTLDSYFISVSGGLITNISESDSRGYPVIINDSLHIGDPAGALGAQGGQNVLVGIRVGTRSTQGFRNTMLGVDTGDRVVSGTDDTYLGYAAGSVATGNLNVMVGSNAGFSTIDSERVVVAGANAWKDGNNMNDSVVIGPYAASNVYNSNNLVLVGANVAPNVDSATDLLVVGPFAASNVTGLSNTIIMGTRAGDELTSTGDDSVIIGHEAGQTIETARTVTIVGSQAGQYGLQSLDNTLVGYRAGRGVSSGATGNKITAVGVRTATAVTSGAELAVLGTGALESVTSGRRIVAIGSELLTGGSGTGPAAAVTTALDGIFIGSNVATSLTSGDRVIVVGHHSANSLDGTDDMLVFGCNSASNFSGSGSTNGLSIVMGNRAGVKQQKPRAIILGHEAAQNANAEDLIAVGYRTARTVKGAGNVFFGNFAAGISNDDVAAPLNGTYNVVMGNYAGFSMSTGSFNVVIGGGNQSVGAAGYDLSTGEGNVLMGYLAGRNLSTGDFNVLMGKNAGQQLAWGSRNFIMGADAASNLGSTDVSPGSLSSDNLILGTQAAFKYTSASELLVVGYQAGYNGTTGQNSVIIGNQAGYTNQVGRDLVYIGNKSAYLNTQSRNIAMGDGAGEYSSTAERFVYIGYRAGRGKGASSPLNNTGDRSVMIGYQAGSNVTTGYQAVYIGYEAGRNNEEGQKSVMIGPNAGRDSTTNRSIFIGTTESDSTGIGYQATGDNLICIGINTGLSLTTGTEDILIGSHAGESLTTGNSHVFIGDDAGRDVTTGNSSVFVGEFAGKSSVTGERNIAVGKNTGRDMGTAVNDVVLMGNEAGLNVEADGTIGIGNKAAKMLTTGTGVIAIGPNAGRDNETGSDLIAIGANAGAMTTGVSGESDSILVGDQAGSNLTTSYQNTVMGSGALKDATTANAVIAIGWRAAQKLGSTNNVSPPGAQYETTVIGYNAVSGGDIGANCTIIGNRAAQNVDNPRVFEGNTFNGPRAGQNANTSVDSVVLGGANQSGSGGVSNFIAGTNTGANVGISRLSSVDITTTTIIADQGMNVTVNAPLSSMQYYFSDGDDIMIEDSDQSQFHRTILASMTSASNTTTQLIFATPFTNSEGETISTGATVRKRAQLSENIGELDNSQASANTLQGTDAGQALTEGSKNVAAGYQAMFRNTQGKYNNVFGAQSGYNIRTDGSTCIGTRAGFSLDEFTYTNNTNGTDFTFDSNTNTISSTDQNLSGFGFGSVFEVEGSSKNDNRYTVVSSNANSIVVQGSPLISEDGVPIGIEDGDIRINSNRYDVTNVSVNGEGLKAVYGYLETEVFFSTTSNVNSIQAVGGSGDTANVAKILEFQNSNIIEISGSKFNDGLYYMGVRSEFDDFSDSNVIYTKNTLNSEVFDSNVTITAKNIRASDGITTGNDFSDFNTLAPFFVVFGANKGVYRVSDELPIPILRDTSNVTAYSDDDMLIQTIENTNDIFNKNYIQSIDYTTDSFEYFNPTKLQPYTTINFFASNNSIVFAKGVNLTTAQQGYYHIKGTSNNDGPVRLNSSANNNTVYTVDSSTTLVDETINADSSNIVLFNRSYFKQLTSDLSTNYVSGQLARVQVEHSIGTKVDKGTFVVQNANAVGSNYTLSLIDDQVLPKFYDVFTSSCTDVNVSRDVNLLICPDIYSVDAGFISNTDNHIHGYDFLFQTANIEPRTGSFTLTSANGSIIANDDYQFTRIVAPCLVKCSNDEYYLVKTNDFPFKRLIIDTDLTPVGGDDTLSFVRAHSISVTQQTANLALMEGGVEYQIFGGNKNHLVKVTPDNSNARAIQATSVYLTDTSNITEYISNDRVISFTASKSNNDRLATPGYFKHVEFSASNVDFTFEEFGGDSDPCMKVTFNNNSDAVFYALSNAVTDFNPSVLGDEVPILPFDVVQITGSANNDCIRTVRAATDSAGNGLETPFDLYLYLNTDNGGSNVVAETGANITIRVNEFRSDFPDTSCSFIPQVMRDLVGDASDFIRITPFKATGISDLTLGMSGTQPNNIDHTEGTSYNFTVSYWDDYNGNVALGSNVYFSNAMPFVEQVPANWTYKNRDVVDEDSYLLSIGTPVLDPGSNATLQLQNRNTRPIGHIDMIRSSFQSLSVEDEVFILRSYGNIEHGPTNGNLSLFSNGSVILTDITIPNTTSNVDLFDNANAAVSKLWGPMWQDTTDGPFKYLKPGNRLELQYNASNSLALYTSVYDFVVSDVIDGYHFTIDPRESNIASDEVLQFVHQPKASGFLQLIIGSEGVSHIVSDRYNFAGFNANVSVAGALPEFTVHKLSTIALSGSSDDYGIQCPIISPTFMSNSTRFPIDNNNIQKNLDYLTPPAGVDVLAEEVVGDAVNLDYGDHLWIIPTSNIQSAGDNTTNLSFANIVVTGALATFTTSNTITSVSDDLSVFSAGQFIKITGATDSNNNGFFKISTSIAPTASTITLDSAYGDLPLTARTDDSGVNIFTNTINSSLPSSSNLAVYLPGQKLIITKTENNNGVYNISSETETSNNSIYLDNSVITESPLFCNIEKSVITDETSTFTGSSDTTFSTSSNTIVTTSITDDFTEFAPGQTIVITGTTNNNGTFTLENIIPGQNTLYVTVSQTETDTSAVIKKKITLIKLGEPAISVSDQGTKQFHYLDAQGNHLMLGSFAGQFTGATALSVHNTHIGGQVGQTNQGSGNILMGNETGRAVTASEGSTTYNNKLAIYKQDFVGVPSRPLIGGDFGSGRVGINTIDPDSLVTGTLATTTKLVINGAARASAFNTFTGTHMVDLDKSIMKRVCPGMILRSIGISRKLGIIDTVVQCDITKKAKDKAVYGVYCHTDTVLASTSGRADEMLVSRVPKLIAYCASVGEGCILVCDIGGELENGDYVMSSDISGYGQLQPDDVQHTYTVAKITEDIDWSSNTINTIMGPDGKEYRAVLASCTYHCG